MEILGRALRESRAPLRGGGGYQRRRQPQGPNLVAVARRCSSRWTTACAAGHGPRRLYQIHRWNLGRRSSETMEALHDLVKAGRIRATSAPVVRDAWQFARRTWRWRVADAVCQHAARQPAVPRGRDARCCRCAPTRRGVILSAGRVGLARPWVRHAALPLDRWQHAVPRHRRRDRRVADALSAVSAARFARQRGAVLAAGAAGGHRAIIGASRSRQRSDRRAGGAGPVLTGDDEVQGPRSRHQPHPWLELD